MMLKHLLLVLGVAVCVALAAPKKPKTSAALGNVEIDNADPYGVDPSSATINKQHKKLDVDFQANNLNKNSAAAKRRQDQNAQLRAANGVATIQSTKGNAEAKKTGASEGTATAKGKTATGARNGDNIVGNTAQHKGNGQFTKTAVGHDGVLTGDGKVQNVGTNKAEKVFTADNAKVNAIVDADKQTKTEGNGQLGVGKPDEDKTFYLYEVARAADGNSFNGQLGELVDAPGRVRKQWRCTAVKAGESTCVDQNGKKAGKVLVDDQGNTVVYGPQGLPIARGTATKVADGQFRVKVSKNSNSKIGLFTADVNDIEERSCYKEVTGKREKKLKEVEIKSIDFEYNNKGNADGSKTVRFPDCFDVVAQVKLAPGVLVEDLAVEFEARVNPFGPLQCMSGASCGRKCYFCNLCEATTARKDGSKRIDAFDNVRTNACQAKGGRNFELRTTVCPPPEDFKSAQCASFDRSLINSALSTQRKSIEGRVLLWQRPKNEEALKKKYFTIMGSENRASNAIKKLLTAQFAAANPNVEWSSITENEKLDFYVRQYGRERLLSCRHGQVDYNLGGNNVDSDFLITAANVAQSKDDLSLFADKPCDEWIALQEQEYAAQKEAHSRKGGNNLLSALGQLISGRRA